MYEQGSNGTCYGGPLVVSLVHMSDEVPASVNDDFVGLSMRTRRKRQIVYLYPECVSLSWDSSSPDPSLASCLGV